MFRQNIWNHMVLLATERQKTILITTHYIEEAKQVPLTTVWRIQNVLMRPDPTFQADVDPDPKFFS